jgi:hypothetical protein
MMDLLPRINETIDYLAFLPHPIARELLQVVVLV